MKPLTESEMSDIFSECSDVEAVETTEWHDDGKYQSCSVVFQGEDGFYSFVVLRSGSYFSDYHFQFYWVGKVKKVEKTTHEWVKE